MQIGRIKGTTRVLGKSQGYMGLPVRDEVRASGRRRAAGRDLAASRARPKINRLLRFWDNLNHRLPGCRPMAEAPSKADLRKRDELAERLLRREAKIAEDLRLIDEDKNALRALSEAAGAGFKIEIEGLGTVEVKAGRAAEITGTSPQLVVAGFLDLTEARRKKLVADGLVEIVDVVKKAAKPSVTVRL